MDFQIYTKNNVTLAVTVEDEAGDAIDLTGAEIFFVVKDGEDSKIVEDTSGGITITDATNGEIEVAISSDDTNIAAGTYKHELLLIDASSNRYTALQGTFSILDSITTDKG